MERLSAWLWRHYRTHYAGLLISQVVLFPIFWGTLSLTVWALSLQLGFRWFVVGWTVYVAVFTLVGLVAALLAMRASGRWLQAWARGDQSDPAATRQAVDRLYRFPWVLAGSVGATAPLVGFAIAHALDLGLGVAVTMVLSSAATIVGSQVLLWIAWDAQLRPVHAELDEAMAADDAVPLQRRVASRLLALTAVIALACAWYAALFTSTPDDHVTRYWFSTIVVSLAVPLAVFFAWQFGVAPLLTPVRALVAGTERVAAGILDQRVSVTSDDEFGQLARSFNRMQAGLLERERLQSAFGSYVDPFLAQQLLGRSSEMFDGEQVEVTVFFADIRAFTTYSEAHTPEETVARLNELFGLVVPILREHGGHANKFLGDGMLAVFGAPERHEDHADRAVDAAIAIQHQVRRHYGDDMRLGIGINTGPVVAGTIGGGGKLEFTLIGDTVNVAARIEELTKRTGDAILMADSTLRALNRPAVAAERGDHEIRGRHGLVVLHALTAW